MSPSAFGASAQWNGTTDANWSILTNWGTPTLPPLAVPGTGDTATFNNAGNGNTTISTGTITIRTLSFDTASAAAYNLTGGTITFEAVSSGVNNVFLSSTVANAQTISSALSLGIANGNQTFRTTNNSSSLLTLGNISSAFTGSKTLSIEGSGNTTIGAFTNGTGTAALTKAGTGTLKLGAAGTVIGGALNVNGGTLDLNGQNMSVAGFNGSSSTITNSVAATTSTLTTTAATQWAYSGTIQDGAGAGVVALTLNGNSVKTLSGNNGYSGATSLGGGSLRLGSNTALGTSALTTAANTTVTSDSDTARTLTNGVTVNGALTLGSATAGFTGDLTFGALSSGGNAQLTVSNAATTFSSASTTAHTITKAGTGALLFTGNGSFGGLTVNSGLLGVGGTTSVVGNLTIGGGVLGMNGTLNKSLGSGNGAMRFTASTNGGFAAYGGGLTVNIGGAGAVQQFGATNFISSGSTLILGNSLATGMVDFQNALNLNGVTQTVQVGDGSAAVDAQLSGVLSNGGLTKTGTGTLRLTGASNYNSATTVSAGTLLVNGSLGNTAVTVANTATLGGTGSIAGAVTVNSGGTLAPGASIETLDTGALTLDSGSTFALEINTTAITSDLVNVTGNLTINSGALLTLADLGSNVALADGTVFNFLDYSGTWNGGFFTYNSGVLSDDATFTFGANTYRISYNGFDNLSTVVALAVIPEPSTWVLMGLGAGFILFRLRSSSRKARSGRLG